MRKVLFISLGCDKNLADSEEMLGMLVENGYTSVSYTHLTLPTKLEV